MPAETRENILQQARLAVPWLATISDTSLNPNQLPALAEEKSRRQCGEYLVVTAAARVALRGRPNSRRMKWICGSSEPCWSGPVREVRMESTVNTRATQTAGSWAGTVPLFSRYHMMAFQQLHCCT